MSPFEDCQCDNCQRKDDYVKWDYTKHSLTARVTPTADLRAAINAASVDVRGMAEIGTVINSVADVTSGETNSKLTPGGGVNIIGTKIRIAGENASNGIVLTNQTTSETTVIPLNAILTNDPSKVSFIVPATLVNGDYKLSITTQFSTQAQNLKEPRTFTFDYILNV